MMSDFLLHTGRSVAAFLLLFGASHSNAQNTPETSTIRVGYSPSFFLKTDMKDAIAAIEVWIDTVARLELPGLETEARIFEDLAALVDAVNSGEIDVAGLLALEYLEIKDKVSLGAGLVGATQDEVPYEQYVLLALRQGEAKDLKRFQGTTLVLSVDHQGRVPMIWLNTLLLKKSGLPEAQTFFGNIQSLDKAFGAIRQVLLRQASLCILNRAAFETAVELNPQLGGDLRVVATSPGFCRGLAFFRDAFDERVKVILQESLLAFHTEPKGIQILSFFRVDKLIAFEPDHLETVAALMRSYETLKKDVQNRPR